MFVRAFTLVLAIAASAIAVPGGSSSQCDTGGIQCCTQNIPANSASAGVLGILDSGSLQGTFGLGCNPIGIVQTGSGAVCQQQPVCCSDFKNNGFQLVGINCSPVNVNA